MNRIFWLLMAVVALSACGRGAEPQVETQSSQQALDSAYGECDLVGDMCTSMGGSAYDCFRMQVRCYALSTR